MLKHYTEHITHSSVLTHLECKVQLNVNHGFKLYSFTYIFLQWFWNTVPAKVYKRAFYCGRHGINTVDLATVMRSDLE